MPAEPDTKPVLKMPPVKSGSGDVDRGLAGENLAQAVDADAGFRRFDAAAVDDAAGHRGREDADAEFPRDGAGIDDPARKHAYLRNINASSARRDHAGVGDASRKSTKPANQTQSIVRCRDRAAVDDGAAAAEAAEHHDTGQSDTIGGNDLAAVADVAKESLGVHEYAATAGDRAGVRYPPGDASRPEEGAIIKINAPADFARAAIDDAAKKGLDRFQKDVALHSTGVRNPAGAIAIPEDANIGYPNAPYRRRNFTAIGYPARESADGDNCDGALARGDCAAVDNTAAGAAVPENGDAEDLNAVPCRDRDLAPVGDPAGKRRHTFNFDPAGMRRDYVRVHDATSEDRAKVEINAAFRGGNRPRVGDTAAGHASTKNREKVVVDAGLGHQLAAVDNATGKGGHELEKNRLIRCRDRAGVGDATAGAAVSEDANMG
jgi:hypothetical protein